MTRFIPRSKLSKKAAHAWKDDSSMSGFCCTGDGTAANAARGSI